MRIVLPSIALVLTASATAAQPTASPFDRGPLMTAEDAPRGAPMFERRPIQVVKGSPHTAPMAKRLPPPAPRATPTMREIQAPPGPGEAVCRDRIEEVRNGRGLPKLDRKAASPDDGLLIAAVDKRIDGCSVMVMRNDTSDIRPLPTAPDGPPSVQRIPSQ